MMRFALLCALLCVWGYHSEARAASPNESGKGFASAYGFILGQEYCLELTQKNHPQLAASARMAGMLFDAAFPNIKAKLEARLADILDTEEFEKVKNKILLEMKKNFGDLDAATAEEFLREVKVRADGKIPSPIFEYLLAAKYFQSPLKEFQNGYVQRFSTERNRKALGIDMRMQVPKTWKAEDNERPYFIQTWTSRDYKVAEVMVLEIQDMEATDKEVRQFLKSGSYKKPLNKGVKLLNSGLFTIESKPGYTLETAEYSERAGIDFYQRNNFYRFFLNGKAISLSCMVTGVKAKKGITDEAYIRIKPMCQQVLNSIILPQVY